MVGGLDGVGAIFNDLQIVPGGEIEDRVRSFPVLLRREANL